MKTILKANIILIISIFFLFIAFININAQDNGQWEVLNQGIDGGLHTVDFINENIGWIAGHGTLLKTENGGETWLSLPFVSIGSPSIPPEEHHDIQIDFISESVGWGLDSYWDQIEDIGKDIIKKSVDGGQSWTIQKENTDYGLVTLYAVNDSIVYVVGGRKILKTSDGGNNWVDISPNLTDITLESVWFIDTEVGVITGYDGNTGKGMILKTLDGGKTWDKIIISLFEDIYDLQFINDSIGYFLATKENEENTEYFLCATTDTFNTWTIKTQSTYPIHSYYVLDDQAIFVIMDDSTSTGILKSTDGGLSWGKKHLLSNWNFNKIYFNKNNVGFTLCHIRWEEQSIIMRSMDFGENWGLQKFNYPLYDIYFFDRTKGFACGGFRYGFHGRSSWGDLLYTDNGGKTWYPNFDMPGIFRTCFFVNEALGFFMSPRSGIYKTTDLGNNWHSVYINNYDSTGFDFLGSDINFINEQIGWAIGESSWDDDSSGAGILETNDGGESWDLVWKYSNTDVYDYHPHSIHVVNTTTWVVGNSGLIVKYTEQDQWQPIIGVTDLPLNDVFFSDEDHGWIAGGYFDEDNVQLILLRTTDGGETWDEKRDLNYQINEMFFEDSLHGWAVGNDTSVTEYWPPGRGIILSTSDGGENWTIQVEDLIAPLTAIHFKDGFGWAVGGRGLVLRTEDGASWVDQNTGKTYANTFSLSQNFPNPFNPSTVISWQLAVGSEVDLSIYNILGEKVTNLVAERQKSGYHWVEWDASAFASGVYFYRLSAKGKTQSFVKTRKLVLLK
jgi:photosystem II stability/assembly factor-like uncharacterized protein